jgi:hypothetical protein
MVIDASPPTPTPNQEREAREERQERRDQKRFRVEIIVAVVLAIYTVVTGLMWRATKKAAEAAEKANKNAVKVFESNERATVFPDPPSEFLEQGVVKITLRNFGKRPAGPFLLWVIPTRWRVGESRPIETTPTESGTFRPDARRIPSNGRLDFTVPIPEITYRDIARIRSGTERLSVYIHIEYGDGFNKKEGFDATFEYFPHIGWVSNTPTFGSKGAEKVPDTPEE